MRSPTFANRSEAGRVLARVLARKHLADPVVLALPRGGVPVAAEIARRLEAPLDIVLVRKIGVPYQRELAAAAVVDGGDAEIVTNDDVMALAGLARADIERLARRELAEIERRRQAYLQGRERVPLEGRTLILVDDGIATGASVRAALVALRRRRPRALVLAVPVAPADTIAALQTRGRRRGVPQDARAVRGHRPLLPRLSPAERRGCDAGADARDRGGDRRRCRRYGGLSRLGPSGPHGGALHGHAAGAPHQVRLQGDVLGRAVGVGLGAHADQAVAQAALQRPQRLPFQAVERVPGGVPLRQGDAGQLPAPVVVVALGAGQIELALAAC